jgi:hypothetical protein
MPKSRIIMPLPFRNVTIFDGPAWYFDDTACIETIYDEDFSAFHRDELEDFYKAAVDINSTCIYVTELPENSIHDIARKTAIQLKYVLNGFSADIPVVIPFACFIETDNKAHIRHIWNLEPSTNLHALRKLEFKIRPNTEAATVADFYKIVRNCCDNNPPLLFTLERFNSALIRGNVLDRIVDITISLESLITGKEELRFKFALFNSFIAASDSDGRFDAFEIFMNLYDARSAIVHGDTTSKQNKKNVELVEANWNEIIKLARTSLNYHLLFLDQEKRDAWDGHLKQLVFGKIGRIVE